MQLDTRRLWLALAVGGGVVLVAAAAFLLLRGEGQAPIEEFRTTVVRWQAPSSGATAVRFLLCIQELQGASQDTFVVAAQPGSQQSFAFKKARPGHEYRACIAGVDARGRQGPWSGWSPVYRRDAATTQP
jgi:hypothetical protein